MKDIFRILLLMFNSLILRIHSDYQPFIFHPSTLEVYSDWEHVPEDGPFAVACPPSSDEDEKWFNQEETLNKKSIFVRKYGMVPDHSITCEKSFDLAVVGKSSWKGNFIEFGYEVYFNKSEFNQYFRTSIFKQFIPVTEIVFSLTNEDEIRLSPSSAWRTHIQEFEESMTVLGTSIINFPSLSIFFPDQKRVTIQELGFIWVMKMVIQFDFDAWNVISLSYFITQNREDIGLKCQNNDLGTDFYDRNEIKKHYLKNQNEIFGNLCGGTNGKCVTKYNLLWPYQFRTSSSFSCSDLASVPVWHENTKELLNYSENFLIAIAAETTNKIKILAGTYEVLELLIEDQLQKIYLYTEKKRIPVPRILFKVVKYQSHVCISETDTCWFSMVIVIHNGPQINPDEKICADKCEEWGWENIQYMTTTESDRKEKSKHIYCCELDPGMEEILHYMKHISNAGQLNLKSFPVFNENTRTVEFFNKKRVFEDKMSGLF